MKQLFCTQNRAPHFFCYPNHKKLATDHIYSISELRNLQSSPRPCATAITPARDPARPSGPFRERIVCMLVRASADNYRPPAFLHLSQIQSAQVTHRQVKNSTTVWQ